MGAAVLLPVSFAVLLAGALLFTNAIEWFGSKVGLGQGAVGSILAAVATALPESLIPVVALIGGESGSEDVATGAILGAPLLLATIAMALVGVAALIYRDRRPQGLSCSVHFPTLERDLAFFMGCFLVALLLGLGAPRTLKVAGAAALVVAYLVYATWTLRHSGPVEAEEELHPLALDTTRGDPPGMSTVIVQLIVALGAIVGGAHIFVEQVLDVADSADVDPLVVSLVLAPFATELPEKANSFFWVRDGKDSLALGNITGAMVPAPPAARPTPSAPRWSHQFGVPRSRSVEAQLESSGPRTLLSRPLPDTEGRRERTGTADRDRDGRSGRDRPSDRNRLRT